MKTKIYQIVIPIIVLISVLSCNLLEVEPKDFSSPEYYYENSEQMSMALTGVYNTLGSYGLYQYTYICQLGVEADEGFYNRSTVTQGPQFYNYTSSNVNIESLWQNLYIGIQNANLLLENINKPVMDETKRKQVKGETLFLRAYYYFILAINFGDVPLILESTKSANYPKITRTPVKQVYEKIIADMTEADSLVLTASEVGFGGRVNRSAVEGILARVCLHMAGHPVNDKTKYKDARFWAKKVIDNLSHELTPDYRQVFINYARDAYNIKESIWEVEFWGNAQDSYREIGHVGNVIGIAAPANSIFGYSTALINATYTHYKSYEAGDLRRDWNCAPYRYSGDTKVNWGVSHLYNRNAGKYRREYETLTPRTNHGTPQNFPLLRYTDVLLMFAEAENELNDGPTTEAYQAVNYVRNRAFGNLMPNAVINPAATVPAGLSKADFLGFLQKERSRELCFEALRKYDLIRWGIFLPTMKAVAAEFRATGGTGWTWGELSFKNVAARDTLMPIPIHETSLNNELGQNAGWN